MEREQSETRYARGLEVLTKINGAPGEQEVGPLGDLGRFITEFGFGDIYTRKGLSLKDREFAAVAMLLGLGGREQQLRYHLRAALTIGVTAEQLEELIIQSALYAGFPIAINALALFRQLVGEMDSTATEK